MGLPLNTVYRRLPPSENEKPTNDGSVELMDGQSIQSVKTEINGIFRVRASFACVGGSPHERCLHVSICLVGTFVFSEGCSTSQWLFVS